MPGGLVFSSIGIGTYLGEPDRATDEAYTATVAAAIEAGANVVDTAINYRFQRSERSIGAALGKVFASGFSRGEIILCTKAGFLTPDGEMPVDINEYFSRELIEPEILRPEDIAAGCHSLAPRFLADQLDGSLGNLGVETVDVFYLHNPETQLTEISADEFRRRIRKAFDFLESSAAAGKIGAYGMATWNAFRDDPAAPAYLSLAEMAAIAREAGGAQHHFRFVQLPVNLAMHEAFTRSNQIVEGKPMPMAKAAGMLGIALVASAPLLQGQLAKNLPPYVRAALGPYDDPALALQFARSVPGITTALAGMSRVEHVRANLSLVAIEPASRDQLFALFARRT